MKLDPAIRDQVLATVPSLRAFAISLCGNIDRADDLVQETLLRALAHIDSFEPGTNMPAWLFTILQPVPFRVSQAAPRGRGRRGPLCRNLEVASRTDRARGVRGIPRRPGQITRGSARGPHLGGRLRFFLR